MEAYNVMVLMEKDPETGFLSQTVDSYTVTVGMEYIETAYIQEEENGHFIYLTLTTKDVEDWEYYGIYDTYDEDIYKDFDLEILDGSGEYNPRWILKMHYNEDRRVMEETVNNLLALHIRELERIMPLIEGEKAKYMKEMEES